MLRFPVRYYKLYPAERFLGITQEVLELNPKETTFLEVHCWNIGFPNGPPIPQEFGTEQKSRLTLCGVLGWLYGKFRRFYTSLLVAGELMKIFVLPARQRQACRGQEGEELKCQSFLSAGTSTL